MPMADVWCPTCRWFDCRFLRAGDKLESLNCGECGDRLVTPKNRDAKIFAYSATFDRCVAVVRFSAAGAASIDDAVEHARYAARIAFTKRLVPYGPEPKR